MAEAGPALFYARGLVRNVAAGARLAFFLPLQAHDFRSSPMDYAVLLAFNFLLWVAAAALRIGVVGEFDTTAILVYLATVALVLLAALLVAQVYRTPERLLLFAVALTSADPVFELIGVALPGLGAALGQAQLVYLGYLVWTWLASARVVWVCAGRERPQLYQAVLAVSAMIAVAFFVLPRTDVWLAPPEDDEAPGETVADERLFHLQGQLIERELAALEPGRPGVAELYFVGFAPDASEDVFLKEMRFVKALFDERLGTAGRSIVLASSHEALAQLPIASVTNLGRALGAVGQAMNPEEDVLFLYLSAHGDREHRLSVSQPPLNLAPLTPTALARMLQDVPVKWRVIVVSACYAGGFIEPLRDANTVVIAAAAADRTSFGCEAGRDFTYFGEAYFRDALAKTRSFTAAFETAKDIVARREQAEQLTPSLPQIWVGAAIAERLNQLAH
jgi:hypothetical protein